jgi:Fic family protein
MKLKLARNDIFQEKYVPAEATLTGLSALVQEFNVQAPVTNPVCVSQKRFKQSIKETSEWRIFDNKYAVEPTLEAHLTFALRHENIDLLVLKRIFQALPAKSIAAIVTNAPTGPVTRRIWFLYEFLTGKKLAVPDCGKVTAVDLLDSKNYFTCEGIVSTRHKVRNNLLGTESFCPVIRRTKKLEAYIGKNLSDKAKTILAKVSPALLARAASFLLLADSQASFAIEGERLPKNKEERWLRAVQQVGRVALTEKELNRLHEILIEDRRFVKTGFRDEGVFLGQRTVDGNPLPEFIGAKPEDVKELIDSLITVNAKLNACALDPVLQAVAIAFGFVYIHPYEDGNGRLHRCLIHHVLAERKFTPQSLVFPVSSVMLKWIDDYRKTLQNHSAPLMPYIEWVPTERGNVEVTNDTTDFYRYFDCTEEAEFLYRCVEETIDKDVPEELDYIKRHDQAMDKLLNAIEMPNMMAEQFIMFMRQNNWKLPKARREKEFAKLSDKEVASFQNIVNDAFAGYEK